MVHATLAVTLGLDEVCSLEGLTSCRIYTRSRHSRGTNGRSAEHHLLNVVMLSDAHTARAMKDALTY
jgi:hypothetical protein